MLHFLSDLFLGSDENLHQEKLSQVNYDFSKKQIVTHRDQLLDSLNWPLYNDVALACVIDNLGGIHSCMKRLGLLEYSLNDEYKLVINNGVLTVRGNKK